MKPDPDAPPKRGRGRPPKQKFPADLEAEDAAPPATVSADPPRSRGRPPKVRDATEQVVQAKETAPAPAVTEPVAQAATDESKGRGRPPKVKTTVVTPSLPELDTPPARASPVPPLHLCTFGHHYNVKVQHGFHLHHMLHSKSPHTIALPGYQSPRLPACSGRHVKRESDLILGVLEVYIDKLLVVESVGPVVRFRFKDRNS